MMVGPEQERLAELEAREIVSSETVGALLPEAMSKATEARKEELALSLEPAVTGVVRTVARRESALFGEILSPTIGAAVRKAVTDAILAMLERFNETLERSVSLRGMKWRLEARRTARPF